MVSLVGWDVVERRGWDGGLGEWRWWASWGGCRRAFVQVRAVVVGLHAAGGVRGINVKGVQVRADSFHGAEVLLARRLAFGMCGAKVGASGT